ncbi:hypothetical protein ANRL1_01588 [Anaerolineae bacterium]|nr:hypothetical protein ANRL1_01588 [Anaerolineae bacterium]
MSKVEPYRQLYFLYVWAEPHDDAASPPVWRYRLEDALTHEQHVFSELRALVEFLRTHERQSPREPQREAGD